MKSKSVKPPLRMMKVLSQSKLERSVCPRECQTTADDKFCRINTTAAMHGPLERGDHQTGGAAWESTNAKRFQTNLEMPRN
jgi:hypothetical protein